MKRTTLFVPFDLERELKSLSRRDGKPMASVVREALTTYVMSRRLPARLPSFVGAADSGRTDVAERHEDLLWTDPHGTTRRRRAPNHSRRGAKKR